MKNIELEKAFLNLHDYVQRNNYKGYEFDDLLSSPFVSFLTNKNVFLKRLAVQVGKLSPLNIRPLLGVRKLESAKARGFFARAYLYYYLHTREKKRLSLAEESLNWLLENSSEGFSGISWGNSFDFSSRAGFLRKGIPTIVWTSLIADSFDLGYSITGNRDYLSALRGAGEFIAASLERHEDERGIYFAYAPGFLDPVHNSNLLGAATFLRCWKHFKDSEFYKLAKLSYKWTLSYMNPDGSLYYGVGDKYEWIDNFHTAYVIDCLVTGYEIGGEDTVPFSVIEKAYQFWIYNFFKDDGTPKYYHNRTYPLDIQCASQAIETLSKLSKYFDTALDLADKVLNWTLTNMLKPNSAFRYQIRKLWKNNLESIHWGESTMLSALGAYLYYSKNIK